MISEICALLYCLGITAKYKGFSFIVYAIELALEDPTRLQLVTKRIYPAIARRFHTSAACVERNIRTATRAAWEHNPRLLAALAHYDLAECPSPTQFIAVLAFYFMQKKALA